MRRKSSTAALSLLLVALLLPTLITWVYFVAAAGHPSVLQKAAYAVGKTAQFLLPMLWLFWTRRGGLNKIESTSTSHRYLKSLSVGAAFGLLAGLAGFGVADIILVPGQGAATLQAVRNKAEELGVGTPASYIALAVFYSIVHAFLEEYYWRWFVYRHAGSLMERRAALATSSLGFAAHHVVVLAVFFSWESPVTYLLAGAVAIGGLFWAWQYERYGTLVGPWFSHLVIDAVIFSIGYRVLF